MSSNYFKSRILSLSAQNMIIKQRFPKFECYDISDRKGKGIWEGDLQPQETSQIYRIKIKITHYMKKNPVITVIKPKLLLVEGQTQLPHIYGYLDGLPELCLFYKDEWNTSRCIADTIIPWASEWFFYYEWWLDNGGVWRGKEKHPRKESKKRR